MAETVPDSIQKKLDRIYEEQTQEITIEQRKEMPD
jgi:hypothetical protein